MLTVKQEVIAGLLVIVGGSALGYVLAALEIATWK